MVCRAQGSTAEGQILVQAWPGFETDLGAIFPRFASMARIYQQNRILYGDYSILVSPGGIFQRKKYPMIDGDIPLGDLPMEESRLKQIDPYAVQGRDDRKGERLTWRRGESERHRYKT